MLLLLSCTLLVSEPSHAAPSGITIQDMENRINDIEQKIKIYEDNISANESRIESELAYKEQLDLQISLLLQKIEIANNLIAEYDRAIADKNVLIAEKEAEIDARYDEFCELLRITQEYGTSSYLEILFSAEDFSEFLSASERISNIIDYQSDVMDTLQANVDAIKNERTVLEEYRGAQEKTRTSLSADEENCRALSEEADGIIVQLQKDTAAWEKSIEETERSRDELNAKLEAELKKLASEDSIYVGGKMRWPTDAKWNEVSSPFGWRTIPWPGFHTGIDIPAPSGTPIYAANMGTVITAEWHSSYGYYIVISHGGGYSTLYAHCNRIYVKKGDSVQKGQHIAGIGTTGASTGNHLHFETRVNGEAKDPLGFVTAP